MWNINIARAAARTQTQHSRTPTPKLCSSVRATTKATRPGRINPRRPSPPDPTSTAQHSTPTGFLSEDAFWSCPVLFFSKGSLCAPGGDGGGAGAPAGGRRRLVGARERLAGVAGRDLLRPRRPLRRRRCRLIRKRLVSSCQCTEAIWTPLGKAACFHGVLCWIAYSSVIHWYRRRNKHVPWCLDVIAGE